MKLEEQLFKLRKKNGKTQEDLAQELSVSRQTISNWETGSAQPTIDKAIALAKLYDISLDELVGHKIKQKKPSLLLQSLVGEVCSIYVEMDYDEKVVYDVGHESVFKNVTVLEVNSHTIQFETKDQVKMLFIDNVVYIEKGNR